MTMDDPITIEAHVAATELESIDQEMVEQVAETTAWVCIGLDAIDGSELWAPAASPEAFAVRGGLLTPGTAA